VKGDVIKPNKQMNLLKETLAVISNNNYSPSDIKFIGSGITNHSCSWDEFCIIANKEYDCGYGSQQVAEDLIVVFNDGAILSRKEYDGSEWWECSLKFKMPSETQKINNLFAGDVGRLGYVSLNQLNEN
jgi:hypothetical protein